MTAQNVLLAADGRVKVADFGIARIGASALTRTGTMIGTCHYLSPEQARGLRADERSDLYSAGVVLFEMLTGRLPFEGDSDVAVALQHVNDAPPRPRDLAPAVPEALERVVLRALDKDPDRRYQTAAEFALALDAALAAPDVAATAPASPARPIRLSPRPLRLSPLPLRRRRARHGAGDSRPWADRGHAGGGGHDSPATPPPALAAGRGARGASPPWPPARRSTSS